MRGLPIRRIFYVQQDRWHVLLRSPRSNRCRIGRQNVGVTALNRCGRMSANVILARPWHRSGPASRCLHAGDRQCHPVAAHEAGCGDFVGAALRPGSSEAKGYVKLADARTYAPLSFIGLVSSMENHEKSPQKVQSMVAALHRTMNYIVNPANRNEVVAICVDYHKIDLALAERRWRRKCWVTAKTATKPRAAVEKEIEIYRESLKVAKGLHAGRLGRYELVCARRRLSKNHKSKRSSPSIRPLGRLRTDGLSNSVQAVQPLRSVKIVRIRTTGVGMPIIGDSSRCPRSAS